MGKTTEFIAKLLRPTRPQRSVACVDVEAAPAETLSTPATAAARELAQAIDDALLRNQAQRADRLADSAARLAPPSARLTESLARLRLATGRPEAALAMIDACRRRPSSLRLLRLVCLMELGRSAEAHLELADWRKDAAMPLAARTLLALAEWEAGDHASPLALLQDNLTEIEDPLTLELLLILAVLEGRAGLESMIAGRLERYSLYPREREELELFFIALGRPRPAIGEPPANDLARLRLELIACEAALPVLVEAQARSFDAPSCELLVTAAEDVLGELRDPALAIACIVQLHRLLGRVDEANHWLQRGLSEHPMAAALARLRDANLPDDPSDASTLTLPGVIRRLEDAA